MILTGKSNSNGVPAPVKIKAVQITNESGAALGISIHPWQANLQDPIIRLVAADDVTAQVVYNGIDFPGGFRVVPDNGVTQYLVEYESL